MPGGDSRSQATREAEATQEATGLPGGDSRSGATAASRRELAGRRLLRAPATADRETPPGKPVASLPVVPVSTVSKGQARTGAQHTASRRPNSSAKGPPSAVGLLAILQRRLGSSSILRASQISAQLGKPVGSRRVNIIEVVLHPLPPIPIPGDRNDRYSS